MVGQKTLFVEHWVAFLFRFKGKGFPAFVAVVDAAGRRVRPQGAVAGVIGVQSFLRNRGVGFGQGIEPQRKRLGLDGWGEFPAAGITGGRLAWG